MASIQKPIIFLAFANPKKDLDEDLEINLFQELFNQEAEFEYKFIFAADAKSIYDFFKNPQYRVRICIFHFSGYVNKKYSLFKDEIFFNQGLVSFLASQVGLQLVVLNVCEIQNLGIIMLEKGIPAVIATNQPFNNSKASHFTRNFYNNLLNGNKIETAFQNAVNVINSAQSSVSIVRGLDREDGIPAGMEYIALYNQEFDQVWTLAKTFSNKYSRLPKLPSEEDFRQGLLEFEIPDVMQQNQAVTCIMRIAGQEVSPEMIQISENSSHEGISITDEMSVKLLDVTDGSNFCITAISTERQAIRLDEITEWKISVTPLKSGIHALFLRVSAHFDGKTTTWTYIRDSLNNFFGLPVQRKEKTVDMIVLEKSILVNDDPAKNLLQAALQIRKKIVFLAADSKSGLLLGRESNKIREELLMSTKRDEFLFTTLFEVTGFDFTRTLLREKPTIVHFSGHGSAKGIFLVNERQVSQLASTKALQNLFKILQKVLKIECLILNACFSKTQAEVVAESIPVVIGTLSKIGDKEAINFSIGFYQGIGEGLNFEDAYKLGRVQVSLNSNEEDAEEVMVLIKKIV